MRSGHLSCGFRGHPRGYRPLAFLWLVVAALLASGCAITPVPMTLPPPAPEPEPRPVPKPTNCGKTLADVPSARRALNSASPGDRLCVVGLQVRGASLELKRSGTPAEPIELVSDGATLADIRIEADNVVVEGFNTRDGDGITARGSNITIRNNDVRGARDDGIRCAPCTDAVIEANTVKRADGSGIVLSGQRGAIRGNDVSGSVRRMATDADGIRFFGTDLVIEHNHVHDISKRGHPPDRQPHADCFQTFDGEGPATASVVLRNNKCANVDAQCLTASGIDRPAASASSAALEFKQNYCQTGADQAVYLEAYPNVVIRDNTFSSTYRAAVHAVQGAVNLTVEDNILVGDFESVYADESSRSGLREFNNQRK